MYRMAGVLRSFVARHGQAVRFAGVVILFAVFLHTLDPREIFASFGRADRRFIIWAVVLMIPNIGLQVLKWRLLLGRLTPRPSWCRTVSSVVGGYFLGAVSPGRAGEMARGVLIPGHSVVTTASLTIADKGCNQILVVVFGLVVAGCVAPSPVSYAAWCAVPLIIGGVLMLHRLRPVIERILHRFFPVQRAEAVIAAFDALSPKTLAALLAMSAMLYCVYVGQFYMVVRGFVPLAVSDAARTLPLVYLIHFLLPLSFGDLGIKQVATVRLLAPLGIAGESAFAASLAHEVITFVMPSIAGGLACLFMPRKRGREDRS